MIQEFEKYQFLLSGRGREEIARVIRAFREEYGENWLEEFKHHNPDYVLLVDLAANNEFPAAYMKLRAFVAEKIDQQPSFFTRQAFTIAANTFLDGARGDLESLHGFIKAEIDKPRFR